MRRKFKDCFAATRKPLCKHIGRHTYLGKGVFVSSSETRIGAFCSIAGNVAIGPSQHPLNFLSTHPFQYLEREYIGKQKGVDFACIKPVNIGNDVWIGNGAKIKAGVVIGDGSIVGMGSVVTHDIPPYAIVAGSPARLLRYRFSQDIIAGLVESEWWTWPEERIQEMACWFDDPRVFLTIVNGEG